MTTNSTVRCILLNLALVMIDRNTEKMNMQNRTENTTIVMMPTTLKTWGLTHLVELLSIL